MPSIRILSCAFLLWLVACGDDDIASTDASAADGSMGAGDGGMPDGTMDAAQPAATVPDYDQVFPRDRVQRLDVVMSAAMWESMMSDLEEVTGQRPGGGDGEIPGEAFTACESLTPGAACMVLGMSGSCANVGVGLACRPGEPPNEEIPQELIDACEGLADGAACTVMGNEGTCADIEMVITCFTSRGSGTSFWPRKPLYVDVEVRFEGRAWQHVGFRVKGNNSLESSLFTLKLPFRFKFDAFEDDFPDTHNQRFFGFQHLSMSNHATDLSYLRPTTTAQIYAAAGVPAPAMAFYELYIDRGEGPEYAGVYTMIEIPDDPMLERAFGQSDGNLYKPDGDGARFGAYDQRAFGKKNNKQEADFSDVETFVGVLNMSFPDAAAARAALEAVFDMDLFLRYLAVTRSIENWDTYGAIPHNYYLFAHDGRLRFMPWDFDLAMQTVVGQDHLFLMDLETGWPLLERVRDDSVYREQYLDYVDEFRTSAFAEDATLAEIQRQYALIEASVVRESTPFSLGTTQASLSTARDELLAHVRGQHMVLRELAAR